jgi:hypothetical protein
MARDYLIFADMEGKLDVLRIECTRCERKGRYSVAKLIKKHGRRGNLTRWGERPSSCRIRQISDVTRSG